MILQARNPDKKGGFPGLGIGFELKNPCGSAGGQNFEGLNRGVRWKTGKTAQKEGQAYEHDQKEGGSSPEGTGSELHGFGRSNIAGEMRSPGPEFGPELFGILFCFVS